MDYYHNFSLLSQTFAYVLAEIILFSFLYLCDIINIPIIITLRLYYKNILEILVYLIKRIYFYILTGIFTNVN